MNVLATMRSHRHDYHHHHQRPSLHLASQHQAASPYEDLIPAFKDLANLVRKQWKCSYLECSVKFNWRVLPIFREIVKSLESIASPHALPVLTSSKGEPSSGRAHGAPAYPDGALTIRCPSADTQVPVSQSKTVCAIV